MATVMEQGPSMGAWWCRKRDKNRNKGSHTAGATKGEMCQANDVKKYMAKTARSYKHKGYSTWFNASKEWAKK